MARLRARRRLGHERERIPRITSVLGSAVLVGVILG
jgi:hypothetical protein